MKKQIDVLVGLPGAGKTTFARELLKDRTDTLIISPDSLREMLWGKYTFIEDSEYDLRQAILAMMTTLFASGFSLIVDESTWILSERDRRRLVIQLRHFCPGATITAWVFPYNPEMLQRRQRDPRGYTEEHWTQIVNEMIQKFEPVTDEEGFHYVKHISETR